MKRESAFLHSNTALAIALLLLCGVAPARAASDPIELARPGTVTLGVLGGVFWLGRSIDQPLRPREHFYGSVAVQCHVQLIHRGPFSLSAGGELAWVHFPDAVTQYVVLGVAPSAIARFLLGRWSVYLVGAGNFLGLWRFPVPYDSDLPNPTTNFGIGAGIGVSVDVGRVQLQLEPLRVNLFVPGEDRPGATSLSFSSARIGVAWLF